MPEAERRRFFAMMNLLRALLSRELVLSGVRALRAHKLRSVLTMLGVIFGVGAVICMLSIGEGASAEQIAQIRLLGSQNIIVRSIRPEQTRQRGKGNTRMLVYGIRFEDVDRIRQLPHVEQIALMRQVSETMTYGPRKVQGRVLGVTRNFFDLVHLKLARGRMLTDVDEQRAAKVCVIGARLARDLFGYLDPLGQRVTVQSRSTGPVPYEVVGVLESVQAAGTPRKGVSGRDVNHEMYIPLSTADLRYGTIQYTLRSGVREVKKVELSDVYVHVSDEAYVLGVSEMVERIMQYARRDGSRDYVVEVPLAELMSIEQTKRTWQIVLGSIAGISLLVGGIGIMNIMLASVTERTREIGIRRALGARRAHITAQFLVETLILSVTGGLIGIVLGIGFARLVTAYADFQTIIPWWAVGLSFGVSALVGVCFGLYPARSAARLDPIEALRYE